MITSLVNTDLITLDLKSTTKDGVFSELAETLLQNGRINNKENFLTDIYTREAQCVTSDMGIAYPHAKSPSVITPAIAVGVSKEPIEYQADDEQPSVFFMIASPESGDHHIYALQALFEKFGDDLIADMQKATTKQQILDLLTN
ncbi:PTS system, fructose-like-1 IIA component [Aliivibrio fischeri ES114]|uniref:PTS system, fructose-like-1 IIA component n=1 Tax=Aliivibrio fischeri (strain ATCC 700601 / ES114) TaxID=312309 RepID=Q5E0K7_ALIF1|nr:PTS sugar transporter subunit IIA [Aliivibrio fischeri]AAW87439.1 PTS system, fructose-like-1 IIA component [Aliivibrio fischeri ES114]KLU77930.1 PTS fructose transporter subunit IIA [Aliivibrio fischeri]MCE7567451.1 PTS sugar transporter subunit IIA [Aliivibrio fischeri]MCE7577085.1 PTS sugar transporter subunit IIA [Aliivibrio fischeri]MCE7589374.1 PTS sugar transporter subunit IIA [Aliivibrio fischeri]